MEEVEKYERHVFDETKKLEQLDGQIHTTRDAMNKLRRRDGRRECGSGEQPDGRQAG